MEKGDIISFDVIPKSISPFFEAVSQVVSDMAIRLNDEQNKIEFTSRNPEGQFAFVWSMKIENLEIHDKDIELSQVIIGIEPSVFRNATGKISRLTPVKMVFHRDFVTEEKFENEMIYQLVIMDNNKGRISFQPRRVEFFNFTISKDNPGFVEYEVSVLRNILTTITSMRAQTVEIYSNPDYKSIVFDAKARDVLRNVHYLPKTHTEEDQLHGFYLLKHFKALQKIIQHSNTFKFTWFNNVLVFFIPISDAQSFFEIMVAPIPDVYVASLTTKPAPKRALREEQCNIDETEHEAVKSKDRENIKNRRKLKKMKTKDKDDDEDLHFDDYDEPRYDEEHYDDGEGEGEW